MGFDLYKAYQEPLHERGSVIPITYAFEMRLTPEGASFSDKVLSDWIGEEAFILKRGDAIRA